MEAQPLGQSVLQIDRVISMVSVFNSCSHTEIPSPLYEVASSTIETDRMGECASGKCVPCTLKVGAAVNCRKFMNFACGEALLETAAGLGFIGHVNDTTGRCHGSQLLLFSTVHGGAPSSLL